MLQLLIPLLLVVIAAGVAWYLRRDERADPPTRGASWHVPAQLDRQDFTRPEAPWLVTVFSSATCLACRGTWEKATLLDSEEVATQEVEALEDRAIHQRYGVDAVPLVLIADADGVVRKHFVGEPTATDLWAAVAELREPGSVPPGCASH